MQLCLLRKYLQHRNRVFSVMLIVSLLVMYSAPAAESETSKDSKDLDHENFKKDCHPIEDLEKLEGYLSQISVDVDKMCAYLHLTNCNALRQKGNLDYFHMAESYIKQNVNACWENMMKVFSKDFGHKRLAAKVAKDHGIDFSMYSKKEL